MEVLMSAYIDRPGELVYSPPYDIEGCAFYSWVVPIDPAVAQAQLIDPCLNFPSGWDSPKRFQAVLPFVMFTFTNLQKVKPLSPKYKDRGWFPEQEAAIWFLIEDTYEKKYKYWHPYMFVDNVWAMAMGREIYGFNKSIATMDFPEDLHNPHHFAMKTLALKTFSPDTEGKEIELMRVTRPDNAPPFTWKADWKEVLHGVEQLFKLIGHPTLNEIIADVRTMEELLHKTCQMVFLKEFRDVVNFDQACYQAIVELDCSVTQFDGGGFLPDDFTLYIEDAASHPIRQQFGIPDGPIKPILGFWAEFGFLVNPGRILWGNQ